MDILKEDVDKLLSYNTQQQVNIPDKFLGILNAGLQLGIVLYIAVYVFVYDKGYLQYEQARGMTTTMVHGNVVATGTGSSTMYFGPSELSYPPLENGNVFIATKSSSRKQKRGVCEDPEMPCSSDDDCHVDFGGKCSANKVCNEPSWCDVTKASEVYTIKASDAQIWIKSAIQFQLDKDVVFTNQMEEPVLFDPDNPERQANVYTIRHLLLKCDPPVRYEEISELGAAIEVQLRWDCNVDVSRDRCKPTIYARRVDTTFDPTNIGFKFSYPEYSSYPAEERTLITLSGIRIYVRTVGTGRKLSITEIIFKISTGLALLTFAPILTDFIMLHFFKQKKKYFARKYDISQDFSEYFDKKANEPPVPLMEDSDEEEDSRD